MSTLFQRSHKNAHRLLTSLMLISCLSLTFFWPSSASVRAQQAGDIVYLSEDFNDNEAQGWILNNGCWIEAWEGNPLIYCNQHNSAMYPSGNWGDRSFTLKFNFTRLTEGMHINILTRDHPPGWDRYAIALGVDYGNPNNPVLHVNLFKQVINPPPPEETVYGGTLDYDPNLWYQATIYYEYGHIWVIINALGAGTYTKPGEPAALNLLLEYQDPKPLQAGGISFESINENSVFIDDVEVWGPAPAPPPLSEPETPPQPEPPTQTEPPSPPEPPAPEPPRLAFAYPECPPGEVLFMSEEFDQPSLPGWTLERGWSVEDGRLKGEGHHWANYEAGIWKNYRLRMIAGLREGRNGLHINTRLSPGNRYFFGWHPGGYYFIKQMSEKYQDIVRDDQRPYDTSNWHSVEMSNLNSRVEVVVDGEVEVSWNDPNPLPPGGFGLETLDDGFILVDSLWVCGPKSEWTPTPTRYPQRRITTTPTPFRRVVITSTSPPRISATPLPPAAVTTAPTPTRKAAGVPPVIPPNWRDQFPIEDILIITAILVGLILLYRWLRRPPPEEPGEGPKPPVVPGLPPIRLINLWLTAGTSGTGSRIRPNQSLRAGRTYTLHAQLQSRGKMRAKRRDTSGRDIPLEVVIFCSSSDFEAERRLASFRLTPDSDSTTIQRPIRPLRPGINQVRVAVYYRNVLLQSAILETQVAPAKGRVPRLAQGRAAIQPLVDYVAASRFAYLSELPRPALNIFTNQSPNGDHWIGLYSSGPEASPRLQQGDLHTFPTAKLEEMARRLRERMAKIEGERMYRMDYPLPPDAQSLQDREQDLVALAVEGFRLYDELFLSSPDGLREERLEALQRLLHQRAIISIARCRGSSSTLPWAALYSFPIDPDKPASLSLCASFKQQVAQTAWHGGKPDAILDHLDQPEVCLSKRDCPLNGDHARQTICPFGFWGFMHQVEQPLQQIQPVPPDQVPTELEKLSFEQRAALDITPGESIRLVMAAYPGLPEVEEHRQELAGLCPADALEMTFETHRERALKLLQEGGRHLYYFYCHGVLEDGVFKLMLGPLNDPGCISAAALDPFSIKWPEQPHPLFILNGCQTMALTPELIHGFMGKLRRLGASGLVGSEVKVWTPLARPFGMQLVNGVLSGRSLGESALEVRLNLLRQGNPLGLVYSLYAPANLHLHAGDQCPRCRQGQTSP